MEPAKARITLQPVSGLRYFCQNAGSCGSMYIVELLKANEVEGCYHEKCPDLDELGIFHYEGKVSDRRLSQLLIHTRKNVFFEANNRLFSMTKVLKQCFPDCRFIHLHRDPRDLFPSAFSKPIEITWNSGRVRYNSVKLCGSPESSILERSCNYWTNYNQLILDDLEGEQYISLKFSDLIKGNIDSLEQFMNLKLSTQKIPPVNANKPVREEGKYEQFEKWNAEDQNMVINKCGPLMKTLGYEL